MYAVNNYILQNIRIQTTNKKNIHQDVPKRYTERFRETNNEKLVEILPSYINHKLIII